MLVSKEVAFKRSAMSCSPPSKPAKCLLFPTSVKSASRGLLAGWCPSTIYHLQLQRCHQVPPQGASSTQETMSDSSWTQPELCGCGTGRSDKISQPQHSFVSADASGMFLLWSLQAERKQASKHNVHWNLLSSEESPSGSCLEVHSARSWALLMHFRCLFWREGSTFRRLGKGHRIVLDKALCVRMSPVSLEPRRCNKKKKWVLQLAGSGMEQGNTKPLRWLLGSPAC